MDREQFVRVGLMVEVGCLAIALLIDAVWPVPVEDNPLRTATLLTTLGAVLVGAFSGIALSAVFLISWNVPFRPFRKIRDFVSNQLAIVLSQCTHWEILLIAAFAGIGEEVLFRGVLQPRIGLYAAAILFGLLHAITPTYIIVAGLLGLFMGWLQVWSGNLWTPIVCHAVYDYIAFLLVIRDVQKQMQPVKSLP